jgi:DmsE family decaheme c-type cytochrome
MRRLPLLAWAFLIAIWAAHPATAQDETRRLGSSNDVKTCTNCHDNPAILSVLHTAHGVKADVRTKIGEEGCQSCHGDSAAHAGKPPEGQPRPKPTVVFKGPATSPVAERNKMCLGCHQGSAVMHWAGSPHDAADIACTSCHASHPTQDPVLVKTTQAPICFTCHAEQRAASLKPSHHPVTEGVMSCSDCHNPHGSTGPHILKADTVNDTCFACHDEKRGPFLWEHAPVTEDCTICHTPHGSVQPSLLKQRPPYLCQNCHDASIHGSQPFSGANLPGQTNAARQLMLHGCVNCHNEIHGSNHPSGVRMNR